MKPLKLIKEDIGMAGGWHSINIPLEENFQAIIDRVNELSEKMRHTNCDCCEHPPQRFRANEIWVESEENGYTVRIWRNSEAEAQAALELLLNL